MSTTALARRQKLTPDARRAFRASLLGTLIEWYDYGLYGAAAGIIIGPMFFPDAVDTASALAAFATFAVGFVARPLGGIIISHLGDRRGRKPAMILSIALMGIATVGIGLLPTAAQIGVLAPLLLVILRFAQGFGAGAELAGAFTLVAEYVPRNRRGLFTGLINASLPAGSLLATLAFLAVSALPEEVFFGWGWRVPFLVSAVLLVLALYMRQRMEETPAYTRATESAAAQPAKHKVPLGELLKTSKRKLAIGFFCVSAQNATGYVLNAFALSFLTATAGMDMSSALVVVCLGSVAAMIGAPLGGLAADRFGIRPVFAFGGIFGALFAVPMFYLLGTGSMLWATVGLAVTGLVTLGATTGTNGAFLTQLFPVKYRFSGVALARELNGALVAGTTPLIATALVALMNGEVLLAGLFVALCCAATAVAVLVSRPADMVSEVETAETTSPVSGTPAMSV